MKPIFSLFAVPAIGLLAGVGPCAQAQYVTYNLHTIAGDYGGSGTDDNIDYSTLPNPYDSDVSAGAGVRRDLFIGNEDVGISAMAQADFVAFKDDLTVRASVRSDVAASKPDGTFTNPFAFARGNVDLMIPLRITPKEPGGAWRFVMTFIDPEVDLESGPGTSADTGAYFQFGGQDEYSVHWQNNSGVSQPVSRDGKQTVVWTNAGEMTLPFVELFIAAASLGPSPGEATGAAAFIDPGLPIQFTDLSPGLTITGPDGHVYASSAVPEPPAFGCLTVGSLVLLSHVTQSSIPVGSDSRA